MIALTAEEGERTDDVKGRKERPNGEFVEEEMLILSDPVDLKSL